MTATAKNFYVIGGTLRPDAPCYVERRADSELYDGLIAGDFRYVLTSRQMGKSSLMVRTVGRLRQEGHSVAVLDLTAIGQNLSVEQWYVGLLERLGAQLDIEDELEDHWELSSQLSPVQRWFTALRDEALKAVDPEKGLVIFIDEIDAVRSLPFSTDEFFAAIRECYNRRSNDPRLERVTFCLLGVATPSDLIQDTRTTPFNIGQRIELRDFSRSEAEPLTDGLKGECGAEVADQLLDRILFWTNGQPYLTQRFCQAVAEDPAIRDAAGVDELCDALFLSEKAREKNDNLIFVRERILRSEEDRAALLDLYAKVWKGKREPDDPSNPLVCVLRLSGITHAVEGGLSVRNRIYARVFDDKWARANMPDAELRRQREAYVSGILRTAGVAAAVVLVISFFAAQAIRQRMRAEESFAEAIYQKGEADEARSEAEQAAARLAETLERMELQQAETAFRSGRSAEGVAHLAHVVRSDPGNTVATTWLLATLAQKSFARPEFRPNVKVAEARESPFYSPDGERVIAKMGSEAHVLNLHASEIVAGPMAHNGEIRNDAREFSPDGGRVATGSSDNTARIWDAFTGLPVTPPMRHSGQVDAVRFSPDGLRLLTVTLDRVARVWDAFTGHPLCEPIRTPRGFGLIHFSADGKRLVMEPRESNDERGGRGGRPRPPIVWDVRPAGVMGVTLRHRAQVSSARFSPDGSRLLTASRDGAAMVWDVSTGERLGAPMEHELRIVQAGFSPDGKLVATVSEDRSARIWNAEDGSPLTSALEHDGAARAVAFSPDGRLLATASEDGRARVWRVGSGQAAFVFTNDAPTLSVAFSPDGTTLATASTDRRIRFWNLETGEENAGGFQIEVGRRRMTPFRRPRRPGTSRSSTELASAIMVRFSPDGNNVLTLVNGRFSSDVRVRDLAADDWRSDSLDHNSFVRSARFDPSSQRIVTASDDRTARVWDTVTGDPIGAALEHGSEAMFAGFFEDGSKVFTFSAMHRARVWDADTSIPLSEPYAHSHEHRYEEGINEPHDATDVSHDGSWLAAPSGENRVQVWEVFRFGERAPIWLAELAEFTAGRRVDDRGLFDGVPPMSSGRLRSMGGITGDGYLARWRRWLLADRGERTISPSSEMTVADYVERLLESEDVSAIRYALHMEPDRPDALMRLARLLMESGGIEKERTQAEALFFARRAAVMAKDDPKLWLSYARQAADLGKKKTVASALKKASAIAEKTKDAVLIEEVGDRAEQIRADL